MLREIDTDMVIVDTSVWIDCFKDPLSPNAEDLRELIDGALVCINDVIAAELLPSIMKREEYALAQIVSAVPKAPLDIEWTEVVEMQTQNLLHGINKVGILDIIIAQNAWHENLPLFTLDKHFSLMADLFGFSLYNAR